MSVTAAPAVSAAARSFIDKGPHKLLIGSEWVEAADGRTFDALDPATGDPICAGRSIEMTLGGDVVTLPIRPPDPGACRWPVIPYRDRRIDSRRFAAGLTPEPAPMSVPRPRHNGQRGYLV